MNVRFMWISWDLKELDTGSLSSKGAEVSESHPLLMIHAVVEFECTLSIILALYNYNTPENSL